MKPYTEYHQHKLSSEFYRQKNVCTVARQLIGKILVTCFDDIITAGRIVETEAYNGVVDKASHAYGGRFTNRTETMYQSGGLAYVYLCYGIHHLFNVVTNEAGTPHAVLIRGIEPILGIDTMLQRCRKTRFDTSIGRGPGNVSKALGLQVKHNATELLGDHIFIAEDSFRIARSQIISTPRIGVDYAAEDALLPYRFIIKGHAHVTKSVFNRS